MVISRISADSIAIWWWKQPSCEQFTSLNEERLFLGSVNMKAATLWTQRSREARKSLSQLLNGSTFVCFIIRTWCKNTVLPSVHDTVHGTTSLCGHYGASSPRRYYAFYFLINSADWIFKSSQHGHPIFFGSLFVAECINLPLTDPALGVRAALGAEVSQVFNNFFLIFKGTGCCFGPD